MFVIGHRTKTRLPGAEVPFIFSTRPFVHQDELSAINEANRLATLHPESEFVRFKAIAGIEAEPITLKQNVY